MAKILKFIHAETGGAHNYGRDALEAFPDKEAFVPAFKLLPVEEEGVEIEAPPLDPDALRQEILAEARAEAERKVQEAYQEGLARGTEAGREAFEASLAQCGEALMQAGAALQEAHAAFLENLEPQILTLVKEIAARVIDVELKSNPDIVAHTVRRALELLSDDHRVVLSLNPQDLEAIATHQVELLDSFPRIEALSLQADESVAPGGCVASTDTTDVDARLDVILAQVLDSLTE